MTRRVEGQPQEGQNPLQRAVDQFQRQASAPVFKAQALQRALDRIRNTGEKQAINPTEFYSFMASLTGIAADLAQQHGQTADQEKFATQQEEFAQTSEQLAQSGEGAASQPATTPSVLQRLTGLAAG